MTGEEAKGRGRDTSFFLRRISPFLSLSHTWAIYVDGDIKILSDGKKKIKHVFIPDETMRR